MPDRDHKVVYRAVANFSSLVSEARRAREELRRLREEEALLNRSSSARSASSAASSAATRDHSRAMDEGARSARRHSDSLRGSSRTNEEATTGFRRLASAVHAVNNALTPGGGGNRGGNFGTLTAGAAAFGSALSGVGSKLTGIRSLFRTISFGAILISIATGTSALVAVLGSLAGVALSAGNALVTLGSSVAALPGLIAAAATGVGALFVALKPLGDVFKAFGAQQKAQAAGGAGGKDAIQAAHQLKSASHGLSEALFAERQATKSLTDARRDALQSLEDLRQEVARASLSEEGSSLALRRAKDEYMRALADPNATLLDREEALHRVREAENGLSDTQQRNNRNAEELNVANKKGVEGSDQVVAARHALAQATYQVSEAQFQLAEAQRDSSAGGTAAAQAQLALQAALDKLSPSARTVVLGLLGMADGWKKVRLSVQERFFAPIVGQLGNIRSLLPTVNDLLGESASAMGNLASKGVAVLASGPWKADFQTLSKENAILLTNMGVALGYIFNGLRNVTMAAIPFTRWVTEAAVRGAKAFSMWSEEGRNTGKIAEYLDRVKIRLQQMGAALSSVVHMTVSWGRAARGFNDWFFVSLVRITAKWEDLAKAQERAGSPMKKWLEDIKPLLSQLAQLSGDVTRGLANMAKNPENIKQATELLRILGEDILPPLKRLLEDLSRTGTLETIGKALGQMIDAFDKFIKAGGGQAIATFFTVLGGAVSVLAEIASLPGVVNVLGGVAIALGAIAAITLVGKFTGLFWLFGRLKWFMDNRTALLAGLRSAFSGAGAAGAGAAGAAGSAAGAAGGSAPENAQLARISVQLTATNALLTAIRACVCATAVASGTTARALGAGAGGTAIGAGAAARALGPGGVVAMRGGPLAIGAGSAALGGAALGGTQAATILRMESLARSSSLLGRAGSFIGSAGRLLGPQAALLGSALAVGGAASDLSSRPETRTNPLKWSTLLSPASSLVTPAASFLGRNLVSPLLPKSMAASDSSKWTTANLDKAAEGAPKVLGAAFMKYVGGPVADFFTKTIPAGWKDATKWFEDELVQPVKKFFTETLPELPGTVVAGLKKIPHELGYALGFVTGSLETFFVETVPKFLTETIPHWFESVQAWFQAQVWTPVVNFIAVEIPSFFTTTIPSWFSSVGAWFHAQVWQPVVGFIRGIPRFFSETLPNWFSGAPGWFTAHVINPIASFINGIPRFFSETVPAWFSGVWGWFINDVIHPVENWFSGLGGKARGWLKGIWSDFTGGFSEGREAGRKQFGGLVMGQGAGDHVALLAEPGEYMNKKSTVDYYGQSLFRDLDARRIRPEALYAGFAATMASGPPSMRVPRSAAPPSHVVNNTSTRGGAQYGDITINNPIKEKASTSLRRTLEIQALLEDR